MIQMCTFKLPIFTIPERRSYKENGLRNRHDSRGSPLPARDLRSRLGQQRFSPQGPSRKRKYRTHEHVDGQSDISESLKVSYGAAYGVEDRELLSSNSRSALEKELKQVRYEVDALLDQRGQLEIKLEERDQESDILTSRISDLEAQLLNEKEKCKWFNSKIKKLIRGHADHIRLQDELRRSQVQLEKLVEDLGLDAIEDNMNINTISDEEFLKLNKVHSSPVKKQLRSGTDVAESSKRAKIGKGHSVMVEGSSQRGSLVQFSGSRDVEVGGKNRGTVRRRYNEEKSKRQEDAKGFTSSSKAKTSDSMHVAPLTSMAAHADDEFLELIDAEEKMEGVGTPTLPDKSLPFPLPPLPSVSQNHYNQYEGDDQNVDVDGHEELEDADIV